MARCARIVTALVAVVLSLTLVAAPAQAGSESGIIANTWIVADFAAGGYGAAIPASAEVTAFEASQLATATATSTGAGGVKATATAGSKLGMIINSVAVLSGVAFLWPGGDDAPELPGGVVSGDTYYGNPAYGWTTIPTQYLAEGGAHPGFATNWTGSGATGTYSSPLVGYNSQYGELYLSPPLPPGSPPNGQCGVGFKNLTYLTPSTQQFDYYVYPNDTCQTSQIMAQGTAVLPALAEPLADPSGGSAPDAATIPHTITSHAECREADGTRHTITNETPPFMFNPNDPFSMPETQPLTCPGGQWLESGTQELTTEGSTETVPLMEPYQAPDWVPQQVTQFPECFPVGSLMCQLEVIKVATANHPAYRCHDYALGAGNPCLDWWTDINRRAKYDCVFGTTSVALKRCQPYAQTFTTGVVTGTPTNPDEVLADPVAGLDPTPEQTPDTSDCVPNVGLELLNPWWVYKAGKCALKWAFVPQEGFMDAKASSLKTTFSASLPGAYVLAITGQSWTTPAGSDCGGIPVDWSIAGQHFEFDLLKACDGFMATTAVVVKLAGSAFFAVYGGLACLRALGAGFGWNPGIGKGGGSA